MKNKLLIFCLCVALLVSTFFVYYFWREHEKHEVAIEALFKYETIIKVSDSPLVYVTKNYQDNDFSEDSFTAFMKGQGYDLKDRLGAGFIFEKDSKIYHYTLRYHKGLLEWKH